MLDIFVIFFYFLCRVLFLSQQWANSSSECVPAACLSLLLYYKYTHRRHEKTLCCVFFSSPLPPAGWLKEM